MSTCIETLSSITYTASYEANPCKQTMVQAPPSLRVRVQRESKAAVQAALEYNIKFPKNTKFDCDTLDYDHDSAFFVADLGEVLRQYKRWVRNLPRVIPYYAVKCNPDRKVIELLASLGTGFDCASKAEISSVLSLGVKPERVIYANPCKAASHIKYAAKVNVQAVTFDNADELHKLARFNPSAELFLRILTDDSGALCQLGLKYGAPMDTTLPLLKLARELNLNIVGVSFHIGSGSNDPFAFLDAIKRARKVFDQAAQVGFELHTLDIGGGFGHHNFEQFASVLAPALDESFPSTIKVIAEPGRYFVAQAFTLAAQIIARREIGSSKAMYYLNDGVYGSFNCILFDHQLPIPRPLFPTPLNEMEVSVWGPTCDSLDCINSSISLPRMEVGEWLVFEGMGAYTKCAASRFNGFDVSRVVYLPLPTL